MQQLWIPVISCWADRRIEGSSKRLCQMCPLELNNQQHDPRGAGSSLNHRVAFLFVEPGLHCTDSGSKLALWDRDYFDERHWGSQ
jgi:hypothetical protein